MVVAKPGGGVSPRSLRLAGDSPVSVFWQSGDSEAVIPA
jgi:hypothetical protein